MRLTLNRIPAEVARRLREKAKHEGKTVDQVAIEALAAATNSAAISGKPDFSAVIGTWVDDPAFEEVRADHESIDPNLWK